MIKLFICSISLLTFAFLSLSMAAEPLNNGQTILNGQAQTPQITTPVIIYTISTCPHCMEAKEYFTSNNIPFINREVDSDDHHMEELMKIYDKMGVPEAKRGVPLIIIGDTIQLQGFKKEKVQEALRKVLKK